MKSFNYGKVEGKILFLHAFSRCDTTSILFNQGKIKCITLQRRPNLNELAKIFKKPSANATLNSPQKENIAELGEHVLFSL